MITRYMSLALLCIFISVKLTSSAEFYLLKVLKAPTTSARNANGKLYLKILPLANSLKKVYQKAENTDKEKYGFPCRPGQICIGKVQHNQNSVVINNGLRDPSFLPPTNYFPYINHLDDTTDTDEYIEVNDDYTPFSDLTRYEKVNIQKRDIKRKDGISSFSTDYFDINDLLRSKIKNASQNYRKSDGFMIESQGKQYMRVDSSESDDRESSEKTDEKETTEDINEEETTEVKHKKRTPKRFKVVKNHNKQNTYDSNSETNSESDDLENFEPITTQRPKKRKQKQKKKKYVDNFEDAVTVKDELYIQRPGNYVKLGSSEEHYRRRLEHFLPKRYHWDEQDFGKLGYYWFNGPQGKYPGPWRISY